MAAHNHASGALDGFAQEMNLATASVDPQGFHPTGPVLILLASGACVLDGQPLGSSPQTCYSALRAWKPDRARGVPLLLVERDTPIAAFLGALAHSNAGSEFALVVEPQQSPPAEAVPKASLSYRASLQTADQVASVRMLAEEIHRHGHTCPAIKNVFLVRDLPPSKMAETAIARASAALLECNCEVPDIDALEYALLGPVGGHTRKRRFLPFTFGHESPRIIINSTTTAQRLADSLRPHERNVVQVE